MGRRFRIAMVAAALAALLFIPFAADAQAPSALSGRALVGALRRGGYVLYFRHAATDFSQSDRVRAAGDWTSCDPSRMRQLSARGREDAARIGRRMRALGIPVGRVLSSEFCRARETARLFGVGEVEPTRELMNMNQAGYAGGRAAVTERARAALALPPAPGTNTVLVAHGNLLLAAADVSADEGGAAVFKPDGRGGFTLVAVLDPDDWDGPAFSGE